MASQLNPITIYEGLLRGRLTHVLLTRSLEAILSLISISCIASESVGGGEGGINHTV